MKLQVSEKWEANYYERRKIIGKYIIYTFYYKKRWKQSKFYI
ncbi:hypothetical protein SanJ4211_0342 [Streptococcus anginosus]|nr:hypothetical protein SanJ4211_0342 [Streptococcus anginosus]